MARILIVDDEAGIREFVADTLALDRHVVTTASDGQAALDVLRRQSFDLIITDLRMPLVGGMDLLRRIRSEQPETEVIMLTAHGSIENAVEAMKLGAFDYLQKPMGSPDELRLVVGRALERRRLIDDKTLRQTTVSGTQLSYGDPAMQPVINAVSKVAPTTATVLLLGESGTGKEVVARAIHDLSPRRDRPFIAVNCAALSESLLESEMFGHEKGAFTGALERRRGHIELAHGGTFFLDEIGELKPSSQAKLLRVLQERTFERVGGSQVIDVDVRWIAATNRDLSAEMARGGFREDLYHRLAVFPIALPPLRARRGDIIPLTHALLQRIAHSLGLKRLQISNAALTLVAGATFPGNIRELANVLERAAILAGEAQIDVQHLKIDERTAPHHDAGEGSTLADKERSSIAQALAEVGGNRRRAAERLGIGERTLYEKIKRYKL